MGTLILKNNEQTGPFDDPEILAGLNSGRFAYEDFAWRDGMPDWQPLSALYARQSAPPPPNPPAIVHLVAKTASMQCATCGQGTLRKRKKYRMSGPSVFIGYILLIPSVIGMIGALFVLLGIFGGGEKVFSEISEQTRMKLLAAEVPALIAARVSKGETVASAELQSLPKPQQDAITEAKLSLAAGTIGAGGAAVLGVGAAIFIGVFSFVGGLLGWLLVMKKKVLQCTACGAVVAAS